MTTYAGKPVTRGEIAATIAELTYYRDFLKSDCQSCWDLDNRCFGVKLNRGGAARKLAMLLHVAINRKAGIPDIACRKQESDYQIAIARDCRRVHDKIRHRVRVYQFETAEIRARFGHLLSSRDEG